MVGSHEQWFLGQSRSLAHWTVGFGWLLALRVFFLARIVPAQPRQQSPLLDMHSVSEQDTEEEKQYQYCTPRLHRQTQSDERNQDPSIRRVADQPVGTLLHNHVVFSNLNCQREEAA